MNAVSERPLAELVREVVADFQEIVRSEVRLAKAEVREQADKAASGAKISAVGAVAALYGVGLLVLAGLRMLDGFVAPAWLSALLAGVVLCAAALGFLAAGRKRLKEVRTKPVRTIETIRENLPWSESRSS
jgi:hypothetical protein